MSVAAAAAAVAALEAPPPLPAADAPTEEADQETFTLPTVFQNQQHLQAPLTCAHGVTGLPQQQQQQPRDRVHQVQPRDRVVPSAPCAPLGGEVGGFGEGRGSRRPFPHISIPYEYSAPIFLVLHMTHNLSFARVQRRLHGGFY